MGCIKKKKAQKRSKNEIIRQVTNCTLEPFNGHNQMHIEGFLVAVFLLKQAFSPRCYSG